VRSSIAARRKKGGKKERKEKREMIKSVRKEAYACARVGHLCNSGGEPRRYIYDGWLGRLRLLPAAPSQPTTDVVSACLFSRFTPGNFGRPFLFARRDFCEIRSIEKSEVRGLLAPRDRDRPITGEYFSTRIRIRLCGRLGNFENSLFCEIFFFFQVMAAHCF